MYAVAFSRYLSVLIATLALLAGPAAAQLSGATGKQSRLADSQRAIELRIASGESDAQRLLPLYLDLARTRALQGDEDGARAAFVRALALDPSFRPEPDEIDIVRSRYLEARGFWAGVASPLAVEARLKDDATGLELSVVDSAKLAARVRVRVRRVGDRAFAEQVRLPTDGSSVPIAGLATAEGAELSLSLLDEHGNRIWQQGSDAAPLRLMVHRQQASTPMQAASVSTQPPRSRTPFYVLGTSAALIGAGAAAGGAFAHLEREQVAQRWNEGRCDGSGSTRASICDDERRRLRRMDRIMGSLYGASGVAIVAAVLLFALMPPARERPPVGLGVTSYRVRPGPGELGLSCELGF